MIAGKYKKIPLNFILNRKLFLKSVVMHLVDCDIVLPLFLRGCGHHPHGGVGLDGGTPSMFGSVRCEDERSMLQKPKDK